jgi:murein DD-endopeptidase MepM/ murein hydrolase activator NlpD
VRCILIFMLALVAAIAAAAHDRLEILWPTPNKAWEEGQPISAFIQPTGSGEPLSGCFGGVRSNGTQFHEGIDIKAMGRDRHGEPTDQVFAVLPGVVRYVSNHPGNSNYGRYIVLEHPEATPAVYTLYAHLARVLPGVREGARVERGQAIAIMGHTTNGTPIPRDRAHLHFEIGVMVTRDFQGWYDGRKFGSPNEHGLWNGFNLMGFDPLDFFNKWRGHQVNNVQDYFDQTKAQVTLRIVTRKVPDFVLRYPSLLRAPLPAGPISGWEIQCDWTGLPFAWRPLTSMEVLGQSTNQVTILHVDHESVAQHRAKVLVRPHASGYAPARDLEMVLQQIFGLR